MKIRNGFVSNSSSSSFVISYKKLEPCPHCGRSDVDVVELIRNSEDYDSNVEAVGFRSVVEEVNHWTEWMDCDNIFKELDSLNDGKHEFAVLSISYHNETLTELLENNKSINIIYKGD